MPTELRIDIVAPPFGGHLYPQLDLATKIRSVASARIHIISTPSAKAAIELYGFSHTIVLSELESIVIGIANAPKQVGSNPFRLLGQLRDNISMMDRLIFELRQRWTSERPNLVIADFAVPVAGLLAQQLGIPWWTGIRAPTVIDTPDGVPPYMGGLKPSPGAIGKVRDWAGRTAIRSFKRTAHLIFRRSMLRIGIPTVYRNDGYERIYSPMRVLIQGVKELEFPCTWPPAARFIGPLTGGPAYPHVPPRFMAGKQHILVSLGTHVRWAKDRAARLIQQVAQQMPDMEFHFSHGSTASPSGTSARNFHEITYLPYDQYMDRYTGCIHHGGSGIMYSCLSRAIPSLVWPQDFDQFDNAARLVHHDLGIRCRPNARLIEDDLRRLLASDRIRQATTRMKKTIENYNTAELVGEMLRSDLSERSN